MAIQNEHGRLIANAAKAAIAPIGCFRRGQSRVWLSDERYWIILVEFQPSGYSKGSYLNVGASWLWSELQKSALSFDHRDRVHDAGFAPFESTEQFRPLTKDMAQRAAREVLALRKKFPSIEAISRHLSAKPKSSDWGFFHAAVAAGLNHDADSAHSFFRRLDALPAAFAWQRELRGEAARLVRELNDLDSFRKTVAEGIRRRRLAIGLPSIDDCFWPVERKAPEAV